MAKHTNIYGLVIVKAFSYTPFVFGLLVFAMLCGVVLYGCHDFSQWRAKREQEKTNKQWEALGITNTTERQK